MKKFLLLLLVATSSVFVANAQNIKFGRVNTQKIIELMPETDTAQIKIKRKAEELQNQLMIMDKELQTKYAAFEKDSPNLSGVILDQRRKDIIDLQSKLESFNQEAQRELEEFRMLLTQPIIAKVQMAIDKVAKLNLITFVIDESQPLFIYMDNAAVKDLNDAIKQELKLTGRKPAAATTTKR